MTTGQLPGPLEATAAAWLADKRRRALAKRADECRASFYAFLREFWDEAEPARPLIDGWYIRMICEFLEQVARGEVRRGVLNCPPGVGKSLLTCVLFPAWVWTWRATWRALFTSHSAAYAVRDSIRTRRVIESQKYREMFPGIELAKDQNRTDKFENTASGFRQAQGVLGATGDRVNLVVVDDPYTLTEYHSKAEREKVHEWWLNAIPSRLDDKRVDGLFVVMQMLGSNDLANLVIERGYVRRSLASEYDPTEPREWSPGDPRTAKGEVLFPELQGRESLDELKRDMTTQSYEAQFNQRPCDLEGGMFPVSWWRWWKPDGVGTEREKRPRGASEVAARALPTKFDQVVISVDCTFRDSKQNDYVVIQAWGCHGADRYLLEQVRGHFDAVVTAQRLMDMAQRRDPRMILVEGKANGDAVIAMLKGRLGGLIAVDPEGGKEARAFAIQPQVQAGNVYLPDGWAAIDEWIAEFSAFPKGKHDDQVDAMTQILNHVRGANAGVRLQTWGAVPAWTW